jgi:hypothetical protein
VVLEQLQVVAVVEVVLPVRPFAHGRHTFWSRVGAIWEQAVHVKEEHVPVVVWDSGGKRGKDGEEDVSRRKTGTMPRSTTKEGWWRNSPHSR